MGCKVSYKASVQKDLRRLDEPSARRILDAIERELARNPDRGAPLGGEFKGLFRHRVGEYRVIYAKTSEGILVLRIAHRKEVCR